MLSIIVFRKKIGIGKNRYRRSHLQKNRKLESAKKIAIGASLVFYSGVQNFETTRKFTFFNFFLLLYY